MENNITFIIADFAKVNKISRSKLEAFIQQQIIPSAQVKQSQAKHGRPMLDSTKQLHQRIINAISFGYTTSPDIAYITGIQDKVTLQNALHALQKHGKISKGQKVQTGKQGRQPFSWKVISG